MRKFPGAVRSVGIFPQVDKKKVWKLHTSMCSKFFLNNQPFNYPGENLVKNFSERKDRLSPCSNRWWHNPANISCFPRRFQRNNFSSCKRSWRRLAIMSWKCLESVLKTSLKRRRLEEVLQDRKCYTIDVFQMSSVRRHQDKCLLGNTLWLLITVCNMLKDLVTKLKGKQQPYIHLLYESLSG